MDIRFQHRSPFAAGGGRPLLIAVLLIAVALFSFVVSSVLWCAWVVLQLVLRVLQWPFGGRRQPPPTPPSHHPGGVTIEGEAEVIAPERPRGPQDHEPPRLG
jgi:hypothetical protein